MLGPLFRLLLSHRNPTLSFLQTPPSTASFKCPGGLVAIVSSQSPLTPGTAVSTACFSSNLVPGVPAGTTFDHFFIIVLENTDYATALQQP